MEPSPKGSTVMLQDAVLLRASLTQDPLHPHSNAESPRALSVQLNTLYRLLLIKAVHEHIRIVCRNVMTLFWNVTTLP
jgi:hypothetical protein